MSIYVTEAPHTASLSASSSDERLAAQNRQALILEGLQKLPVSQQQFILDFIEFLLERSLTVGEGDHELPSAIECFQRGWEDILAGKTVPLDQLGDGIDDE